MQCAAFDEPPLRVTGDGIRYDQRDGNDDYTQPGNTQQEIQLRQICHFIVPDPAYGIGVDQALGIDLAQFMPNEAHNSKP